MRNTPGPWQARAVLPEDFFLADDVDELTAPINHGADFEASYEDFFIELPLVPDCDCI
jgi:hypothetical protein